MTDKPNLMRVARAIAECDERTQAVFMRFFASMISANDVVKTFEPSQDFGNKRGDEE